MDIPFGLYAPDLPAIRRGDEAPRSPRIVNAIPGALGYYPFPSPAIVSDAMASTPKGGASFIQPDGSVSVMVASDEKLYSLSSGLLTDITRTVGGDYATGTDDVWRFVRHGDDVIATNYADDVQRYVLGTSTDFEAHFTSTLKPKAKYLATIGEFLVIGYTNESGTAYPRRIRWTNINDNQDIDPSVQTQSDLQEILDSGEITGLVGDKEYGIIITENFLHRMDYTGGDAIFSIDKIEGEEGTQLPMSVAARDGNIFMYSNQGFRRFVGVSSVPIGTEQVDAFFRADLDYAYRSRIRSKIDPINKIYVIAYPGDGHTSGRPNHMLLYRWDIERWGYVEDVEVEALFDLIAQGMTLEQLDNISSSLDALEASLDSSVYSDGRLIMGGIDGSGKVVSFNGPALTAYFDTAEMEMVPGMLSQVVHVRADIVGDEDTAVTVKRLSRNTPYGSGATYAESDYRSAESSGEYAMDDLDSYRYHRFRVKIEGGFEHAKGLVDVEIQPDGEQ